MHSESLPGSGEATVDAIYEECPGGNDWTFLIGYRFGNITLEVVTDGPGSTYLPKVDCLRPCLRGLIGLR